MIPDHDLDYVAHQAINRYGALQDQWEFATLLTLVRGARPASMLEIGSYSGGSLWAWGHVCKRVHAITLGDNPSFRSHGASVTYGDSTHPATRQEFLDRLQSEGSETVDFVFIDGGHDDETSAADMEFALHVVDKGIIAIHDINLHLRFPTQTGPRLIWEKTRGGFPHFEVANIATEDPGFGIMWVV